MSHLIVDRIKLLDPSREAEFVQWVQQVDYAGCAQLPSLRSFRVARAAPGAGFDFFEIIEAESAAAFERDMRTAVFAALVERFTQMAFVVETFAGEAVPPGYLRLG